jgi:hypothetical protein
MADKPDKQLKGVETVAVETRIRRPTGENTGSSTHTRWNHRYDGSTSWTLYHHQLKTVTSHSERPTREKATCKFTPHHVQAAGILQWPSLSGIQTYRQGSKSLLPGHQLAALYRMRLKARDQAQRRNAAKRLWHLSNSWRQGPLSDYLWASCRGKSPMHLSRK